MKLGLGGILILSALVGAAFSCASCSNESKANTGSTRGSRQATVRQARPVLPSRRAAATVACPLPTLRAPA